MFMLLCRLITDAYETLLKLALPSTPELRIVTEVLRAIIFQTDMSLISIAVSDL